MLAVLDELGLWYLSLYDGSFENWQGGNEMYLV